MRAMLSLVLIIALLLSFSSASFSRDSSQSDTVSPQLHLHRGVFDARSAQPVAPTPGLAAPAPGPYSIIQFAGPITPSDRQALERTGLELLEYLPDYAYLVRGTDTQLRVASRLPRTYARTPFTLADKLAPSLLRAVERGDSDSGRVRLLAWPGGEGELAQDLQQLGIASSVRSDADQLVQLASLESVRWIEPVTQPRLLNDVARGIMNVDPVWQNRGLFGSGQVIAIADSGLDTGNLGTLSPDFAGRIAATHVLSAGGHWDDNNGHGTHVAGSAAGAGVQSGADPANHDYAGSFAGVAPEANLVIQAFEASPQGEIIGLDPDYYELFDQAYTDGARLHSDSWGDWTGPITDTEAAYGGYPFGAQRTDEFLWEHPDMAIFVAAGNSGADGTPGALGICDNGDGVVDPDSLLSPGTAKNVITVGAGESLRASGGMAAFPWLLLSLCFVTQPIATDTTSDDPNGMAAFSSRGPADDERIKPDIVAPGTNIISARSHYPQAGTLWGVYDNDYVYSGGSSMATPLVAGSGVLVRQWMVNRGMANPSGAAVKSVLLNTTYDMAPGQYGVGATQEITYTRPNIVTGWGRADLAFMVAPAPYRLWLDDHVTGLVTGQAVTYTHTLARPLEVLTDTQPLRVMLAWTDYPASLSAAAQLVNDLDLMVSGPGGLTWYGNDVPSGDRINNVEGVIIDTPPLGEYEIVVRAFNAPMDEQPFALAVGGPLGIDAALSAVKTASAGSADVGETITYTYRIANTGSVTVTDLVGRDDKLGPVAFSSVGLGLNESATGTLTYTLRLSDLPGPLTNTVYVSATSAVGQPITTTTTASAQVQVANPAAITVTKVADVDVAEIGQTITYTYRVTNTGRVEFLDIAGDDDKLGPIVFDPTSLEPQQAATGSLTYTVRSADWPGLLRNTVQVSGTAWVGEPLSATATAETEVATVNPLAMVVTKVANVDLAAIGQTITYTYRVTNTGTVELADIAGDDDKLGPIAFDPTNLEPEQGATGSLTYTVKSTDWPGLLRNTVQVSGTAWVGEPMSANATAETSVAIVNPLAMVVAKSANLDTAEVGQTITYTYRVTNTGTVDVAAIAASDDVLGDVILDPIPLAPEQSASGTLTYTVAVPDWPGPIRNTVTVTGTAWVGEWLTATSAATATVVLTGPVDLTVRKTVNTNIAELGQTVTYTYRITNSGSVSLTDLAAWDDKLGTLDLGLADMEPDAATTVTLTYTIRTVDLPGPLTNTVTVSGTAATGLPLVATATDRVALRLASGINVFLPVVVKWSQ